MYVIKLIIDGVYREYVASLSSSVQGPFHLRRIPRHYQNLCTHQAWTQQGWSSTEHCR